MSVMGKYIYGIINSDTKKFFGPCGVTACEDVYTIPFQDISAVVRDSEIIDCNHMLKNTLARLLVGHQEVIERIMSLEYTIIPVRLGTFALDENEVRSILSKGYRVIKEIFKKINNKIEIDVVTTWSNFTSVLKEVGEEKEVRELKVRLLANPKGITIDDQMKIGVMVKKALDKKREKYAFQIQDVLKVVSQDFKVHDLMDDKMILNSAFLINKDKHKDFEDKIEKLNAKFTEELNFRCVGPLPPYSFYTLEIKKIQFKEIDWARKKLGLNDFINKDEIKKAYRNLALSSHPDKNSDKPDVEREFGDMNRAYKMLFDYCQVLEYAGERDSYSFSEEEFEKNAILVKVRE